MADKKKTPRQNVFQDVAALAVGLGTTLAEGFRPITTVNYPEEKSPRSQRYRGRHYLRRYENRRGPRIRPGPPPTPSSTPGAYAPPSRPAARPPCLAEGGEREGPLTGRRAGRGGRPGRARPGGRGGHPPGAPGGPGGGEPPPEAALQAVLVPAQV